MSEHSGVHLTQSKTAMGHDLAKQALTVISMAYPGYSWAVRCDGGVIDIKCAEIGRASMIRHIKDSDHDAAVFRRDLLKSVGEFLERAHLRRGRSEGVNAQVLEGGEAIKWKKKPTILTYH